VSLAFGIFLGMVTGVHTWVLIFRTDLSVLESLFSDPLWRAARHPGLLSLRLPSVAGWNEYLAKAGGGGKQAYRVTHQPVHVVSQCSLMPGW